MQVAALALIHISDSESLILDSTYYVFDSIRFIEFLWVSFNYLTAAEIYSFIDLGLTGKRDLSVVEAQISCDSLRIIWCSCRSCLVLQRCLVGRRRLRLLPSLYCLVSLSGGLYALPVRSLSDTSHSVGCDDRSAGNLLSSRSRTRRRPSPPRRTLPPVPDETSYEEARSSASADFSPWNSTLDGCGGNSVHSSSCCVKCDSISDKRKLPYNDDNKYNNIDVCHYDSRVPNDHRLSTTTAVGHDSAGLAGGGKNGLTGSFSADFNKRPFNK
ncbi:unnamed protein product [Soboliphyme baturini]|uniref:Protein kinase domain-containing protein n=1 Tax=Soboliphyme baturini TaxID=241478 RepID=A0A183IV62_9BILA|nr:unnamed protein product [Soboliphyme baturini]